MTLINQEIDSGIWFSVGEAIHDFITARVCDSVGDSVGDFMHDASLNDAYYSTENLVEDKLKLYDFNR